MFPTRPRTLTATAIGLLFMAALPLTAQVAGGKNVVINQIQPDQGDGQGLSVEVYNYGPDQVMTGWHLEFQIDNGSSTLASGYQFPAFTLPRHGFAVVHWAGGTDGAVHLYRGPFGSPTLSPDGELRLCNAICNASNGVDYVLWGAPSPTNRPTNISWNGSVPYGNAPAQGYLQRSRDLNTRDAGDWTVLQQTADAALNPGQKGVRRHGRVMINEVYPGNGCGGSIWVELYNPNPFTVSLNNSGLLTYNSSGTVCQNQTLSGTLAAGGLVAYTVSGCGNWRTNGVGEVILTDFSGEGWDYMSFGNPATHHVPADLRWTGPDPVGSTVIYRTDDLDGDNGLDWSISGVCATPTQGALNPGQKGARIYDEIGGEVNNFPYTVPGRGNQFNVTTPFFLLEWKLRAQPAASAGGVYLAIYQQNGANWNRIYQKALGSSAADGIYSTGAANLQIPVGVYRFMFYNGAGFNVLSTPVVAEKFTWGTYQGVANEAAGSYPPPATTPMGAYNAAGSPIQQYFLTDAMPAITTTSPLAPCDTGVSCSRTFAATGAAPMSWQYTGTPVPGLTFNGSTGALTGIPTAAGTYNFNISVTDGNGMVDAKPFTLVVNFLYGPLSITTTTIPGATLNVPYNAALAATGGDGNYTWTLAFGSLPSGMAVSPAGAVYGQPFQAGSYSFSVRVTDGQGVTALQPLSLVVTNALHIVNTSLPTGYPGINYPATTILAAGGSPPYTVTLDATSPPLPPGITFSAGVLSGKPTVKGTVNLVFRVSDAASQVATRALPLNVTDAPPLTQWEGRGLFGGDATQVAASPRFTTDNTVFAAGLPFEIYRSDDGGNGWSRHPVDAAFIGSLNGAASAISSLVISPAFNSAGATAPERTVFVLNEALGVYRSTDRGDSFIPRNIGLPPPSGGLYGLAISPGYAASGRLWITANNTAPFPDNIDIYTTTNGGDTWSYLSSITDASFNLRNGRLFISPTFATDNTMFALMGFGVGGTMYKRSTDGGLSWGAVGGPAATSCGTSASTIRNIILSPNYAVDHTLFGEDSCGVISRSVDSGATFTTLAQRGVALALLSRPGQTPLLYLKNSSALYGLSVSDNYGESFSPVYAGGLRINYNGFLGPQRTVNAIAPVRRADGTAYLMVGHGKGVDGSTDDGQSFNPRERGLAMLSAGRPSTYALRVAMPSGDRWLHSLDGGLHWVRKLPPWPADANGDIYAVSSVAIAPDSGADGLFISGNDQLYRSTNGGQSWTQVAGITISADQITFAPSFTMCCGTMFLATFTGAWKSTNGGASFTRLTALDSTDTCTPGGADDVRSITVSPSYGVDATLFTGTYRPCKSSNGGATWSAMTTADYYGRITPSSTYNNNAASNANNAWTLYNGSSYGLQRSVDRGVTWTVPGGSAPGWWEVVVSPNQVSDGRVLGFSKSYSNGYTGMKLSTDNGASFAPLTAPDQLLTQSVTGLTFPNATTAVAATDGGGLWRSVDGGISFAPLTDYQFLDAKINALGQRPIVTPFAEWVAAKNRAPRAPAAAAAPAEGDLLAGTDQGVFISTDAGETFDVYSQGLGTATKVTALQFTAATPSNPVLIARPPSGADNTAQLFRLNGTTWAPIIAPGAGSWNSLYDGGAALYATRLDGVMQRSSDGGLIWNGVDTAQNNIAAVSYNNATGPTALAGPGGAAKSPAAPASPAAVTATYWSVAATSGARYTDIPSSSAWLAAPGSNSDYLLPILTGAANNRYTAVQALGINAVSGGREVLAGTTGGLYLTRDGGATWRNVSGPGSGLEASSGNFAALLSSPTAFSTTDVLVGAVGSTNGGVYLTGDGGEHWTQINQGFDPNSLNISTLVKTSCNGCPVQYYTGTYGSGVYTRTVAVVAPPAVTGWFFGSTSGTCAATPGSGPEQGGQPFKLCGSGFLALPTVEFDGVPATGCAMSTSAVITCTGTPAHIPGNAVVRVRNTDTRQGLLASPYTYLAGAPRVVNSLRIAKSGGNANLTWTCAGCSAGAPARVYRSQNAPFTLYLEQYNGGTGGAYSNTGALAPTANPSYFWNVE